MMCTMILHCLRSIKTIRKTEYNSAYRKSVTGELHIKTLVNDYQIHIPLQNKHHVLSPQDNTESDLSLETVFSGVNNKKLQFEFDYT